MIANFVSLASGLVINTAQIGHIDFRKHDVLVSIGPNTVTATGEDAQMLRDMFEHTPAEREAANKARLAKAGVVGNDTAATNAAAAKHPAGPGAAAFDAPVPGSGNDTAATNAAKAAAAHAAAAHDAAVHDAAVAASTPAKK